jgi:sugar lactone lactonase YvrE
VTGGTLSILASGHFDSPEGVAVDSAGNVYVADTFDCEIDELSASGASLAIIAGSGACGEPVNGPALHSPLDDPGAVAVDSAGNVYVADTQNCTVEEISGGMLKVIAGTPGTCGATVPGPATSSPLNYPSGVAVDASGNVYIADTANDEIDKVTPAGSLSSVVGGGSVGNGQAFEPVAKPATESGLDEPDGVAVDASGNLYIGDSGNCYVERVTPAGAIEVIAGSGANGLPTPGRRS